MIFMKNVNKAKKELEEKYSEVYMIEIRQMKYVEIKRGKRIKVAGVPRGKST